MESKCSGLIIEKKSILLSLFIFTAQKHHVKHEKMAL
jgi:hypothetical protein